MDIFTHALVGAVTGGALGHPLLGAVVAVLPDLPLWVQRRPASPPAAYLALHSGLAAVLLAVACALCTYGGFISVTFAVTVVACWLSHIVLDVPTHGNEWQPRLLWPNKKYLLFPDTIEEWEFFNLTWLIGLKLAVAWIVGVACLVILYHALGSGTGFQF